MIESIICDNCIEDGSEQEHTRCRADESSCVDGKECPDYMPLCLCSECGTED